MKPRIRHDPGRVARLDPESPQVIRTQRPVSLAARKHPFPGRRFGEAVQQLPRRLAEQNVPRPGLRVAQGQAIRLDLAPGQAAYLAGLLPINRSRRTAATQTGCSSSRRRRTAPSFARSSAPSSRPRGGRRYDARNDILKCPRGKILRLLRVTGRGRFFSSRTSDCTRCPLKGDCLPKTRINKEVVIPHDYLALIRARRRHARWSEDDRRLLSWSQKIGQVAKVWPAPD